MPRPKLPDRERSKKLSLTIPEPESTWLAQMMRQDKESNRSKAVTKLIREAYLVRNPSNEGKGKKKP